LHIITTHVIVDGAARAAEWYAQVFGAEERSRITLPDGRLIDVQLSFDGSRMVLADEFPEHGAVSPQRSRCSSAVFYLDTDDLDSVWSRALAHGADVLRPVQEWFTGERDGQIVDPFGHRCGLSQRVREVPRDEVERAAAAFFGGAATS